MQRMDLMMKIKNDWLIFHEMNNRGAYLMLSNSDPKNEDPEDSFLMIYIKNSKLKEFRLKDI